MIEQAPISPPLMYDEAELYTYTCTHDNKYDWRMPTQHEWNRTAGMRGWYDISLQIYQPLDLYLPVISVRTV
jgi:hypothetical protein